MDNVTISNQVYESDSTLIEREFEHLVISADGESYLLTTAKWSQFLAILGFIGIIFMLIAGIGMMLLSKFIGDYQDFQQLPIPGMYVGIGGLYIIISILYFFPCYYLLQFANKTKEGLKIRNQEGLDEGLKNMKRLAKFVGIMTITLIGSYLILIPIMVIYAMSKQPGMGM